MTMFSVEVKKLFLTGALKGLTVTDAVKFPSRQRAEQWAALIPVGKESNAAFTRNKFRVVDVVVVETPAV